MDVTTIRENGTIDTPFELLIVVLIVFAFILILFKIANFLESLPVADASKKKKVKETKKEIKKEVKKEVAKEVKESTEKVQAEKTSVSSTSTADTNESKSSSGCGGYVCPYSTMQPLQPTLTASYDNYLYDRFTLNPTSIDYVENKKISEDFLSEEEVADINKNIEIKVQEVDASLSTKERLHKRISEMTSHNKETREKLLDEFEGLSREMKLLIMDNIISKM